MATPEWEQPKEEEEEEEDCPGAGDFVKDQKRIFYSGGKIHHHGVGLILNPNFSKSVLSFYPKSDRMLLVKLRASSFHVNIIVVYAPTTEADDEEFERFFDSLDELWKCCKSQETTIIMGDWNAKVGQEKTGKTVGSFGLGMRNNRGDRLVDWCIEHRMVITNTWFKVHPRRYTWTQPGDPEKNQIDFILINEHFRQAVKQSQAYPNILRSRCEIWP